MRVVGEVILVSSVVAAACSSQSSESAARLSVIESRLAKIESALGRDASAAMPLLDAGVEAGQGQVVRGFLCWQLLRRESASSTRAFRHHMHRWAAFAFVFSLVFLLSPQHAAACACCSDPGYRSESRSALTKYERGILGELRFASDPDIYSDDSDDSVRGMGDYADELRLTVAEKDGAFTFTFKDAKGVASRLVLPRPKVVDRFVINPRNDKDPKSNGPVLYKEWRFKSVVTGSGIFQRGLGKNGTARLVLQGRGLRCDDAQMFTHWTLTVTSAHAKYTFFGKLAKPAAP